MSPLILRQPWNCPLMHFLHHSPPVKGNWMLEQHSSLLMLSLIGCFTFMGRTTSCPSQKAESFTKQNGRIFVHGCNSAYHNSSCSYQRGPMQRNRALSPILEVEVQVPPIPPSFLYSKSDVLHVGETKECPMSHMGILGTFCAMSLHLAPDWTATYVSSLLSHWS